MWHALKIFGIYTLVTWAGGQPSYAAQSSFAVSIPPQVALVQAIYGNDARIETLLPPGADEHTFQPSIRQLATIAKGNIYFSSGLPFEEGFLPKLHAAADKLKIVDVTRGIPRLAMAEEDHDAHLHGNEGTDPHLWLDPMLVKAMARNICDTLSDTDNAGRTGYERRFKELAARLDQLDATIRTMLAPYRGAHFLVFHPSFGYFAARYGLHQDAIETEGKEPSPTHLQEMIALAKKERISAIIVQPQFSDKAARAVAEAIHARIVSFDTMAPDLMNAMESLARTLAATLHLPGPVAPPETGGKGAPTPQKG